MTTRTNGSSRTSGAPEEAPAAAAVADDPSALEKRVDDFERMVEAMQKGEARGRSASDAVPWRMVLPALVGVALLGLLAAAGVVGIVLILWTAPADAKEPIISQYATGLSLLGSLASAAVGGIAGMLTLVFRGSGQGDKA